VNRCEQIYLSSTSSSVKRIPSSTQVLIRRVLIWVEVKETETLIWNDDPVNVNDADDVSETETEIVTLTETVMRIDVFYVNGIEIEIETWTDVDGSQMVIGTDDDGCCYLNLNLNVNLILNDVMETQHPSCVPSSSSRPSRCHCPSSMHIQQLLIQFGWRRDPSTLQ
jgi:hypothetical protein